MKLSILAGNLKWCCWGTISCLNGAGWMAYLPTDTFIPLNGVRWCWHKNDKWCFQKKQINTRSLNGAISLNGVHKKT
jgi:hypothetical protein